MSNSALQAEVSRLRSILAEIERENMRLRGEISQGVNTVNSANRNLTEYMNDVTGSLQNSAGRITEADNLEEQAYQLQLETERLYPLFKNMEEANKNIRELNNKKYYEFANYRTVRKIMQGLMDNLDMSLVKDELIYKAVEKNHLQKPDFWLTSAMIAIMDWKNDRRQDAERAILHALELNRKNTIIFFMIFNLRMGRDVTAANWLLEFEKCDLTGDDKEVFLMMFSLVSKTLKENVSPELNDRIRTFVDRVIRESEESAGYSEDLLIRNIASRLMTLRKPVNFSVPNLARCMEGYSDLAATIDMAANNYSILERIAAIINVSVAERNLYLKEFMDRLISRPNNVEKDTYEQIAYNELIIRCHGDIAAAQEKYNAMKTEKESEINLVANIVDWIGDMDNEKISGQMRYNMFTLVSECEKKGVQRYTENYRARYKEIWPVKIGEYATSCNFSEQGYENQKITDYFRKWLENETAKINNNGAYIAFAVAAVILGAGIYFKAYVFAAVGALLAAAAGGIMIFSNGKKKAALASEAQSKTDRTTQQMQTLFDEFSELRNRYHAFDSVTADIEEQFTRI